MPIDPNDQSGVHEEEEESARPKQKRDKDGFMRTVGLKYEFDCPECDANNPWDEGFKEEDELVCHYCGQELRVLSFEGNRIKWKVL